MDRVIFRGEGGRRSREKSDLHGARDVLRLVADSQLSHLVVACCQHLATVCTHTHTHTVHTHIQYTHTHTHIHKGVTYNAVRKWSTLEPLFETILKIKAG